MSSTESSPPATATATATVIGGTLAQRPKKRALTEARREQNREAQRTYRKRQRELRQRVREETSRYRRGGGRIHCPLQPRPDPSASVDPQASNETSTGIYEDSNVINSGSLGIDTVLGVSDVGGPSGPSGPSLTTHEHENAMLLSLDTDTMGATRLPLPSNSTLSAPDSSSQSQTQSHETPSAPCSIPPGTNGPQMPSGSLAFADPYQNSLQLLPTTIFSAVLHNGICLGFDLVQLATCGAETMSPFYRPDITPATDPQALLLSPPSPSPQLSDLSVGIDTKNIPPHLRPTLAQLLIPHHASLDLIPLPFLRERAILLSAAMPHLFNLWELKRDIYERGGLAVWRKNYHSSDGGLETRETGCQPWEMTSWEAAPWFLRKWCMVIGGEDSELHRQSRWWRALRGPAVLGME